MKVLVTGGTGFVGSHTVAAITRDGHDVRLLVRTPARVAPALAPLGVTNIEAVAGDVTDAASVRRAVGGCDAVIHAGSMYSLDTRKNAEMARTNVEGTRNVVASALSLGLDPIVHVSSYTALLSDRHAILHPDYPPRDQPGGYMQSKTDSDRLARRFQEEGAPVTITYPSIVWGPHDPNMGETAAVAVTILKGLLRIAVRGGGPVTDVRDAAALHAALLQAGKGPRRYITPSTYLALPDLISRFSRLTGRKLHGPAVPSGIALPPLKAMDALQRVIPVRLPFNYQATYAMHLNVGVDDSRTREEFGLTARPLDDTLRDTLVWLYEAGHVSAKMIGKLALEAAVSR